MSSALECVRGSGSLKEPSLFAPRINVVPLITPRYQKKQRANRLIHVTDTSEEHKSATAVLQEHTKEMLTVHNGKMTYEEEMHFHPYELFKHGKHRIHSRSVGYSSDGDLVLIREAISEPSDVDLGYVQRRAEIDKAVCLNPKAQRPLTSAEAGKKLRFHNQGLRKYPGIRAPKNRKTRNRLLNDYFASKYSYAILKKYNERQENGEGRDDISPVLRPAFAELPPVFGGDFLDLDEDAQTRALEKSGVSMDFSKRYTGYPPRDVNSGEARFQGLSCRLRGEMIHALNSEFLSSQIEGLENDFSKFILDANRERTLRYRFRDGYGRLVCHGVAAYYLLVSESQLQGDGSKITVVSWPKKKRNNGCSLDLPRVSLMYMLCKNRSDMPLKHSASGNSTPQSTPRRDFQQPDTLPPKYDLDETKSTPVQSHDTQEWPTVVVNSSPEGQNADKNGVAIYEPPLLGSSAMTAAQKKKKRKAMNTIYSKEVSAAKDSG